MTITLAEPHVETRAAEVAETNFAKRLITVIAMPYEQPTRIFEAGRSFDEVVSRGAFDGVERRTAQIRAFLDHVVTASSTIGRAVALHPSRTEGLVAELKIGKTHPMGDHTLEMAAEGGFGASAGFTLLRDDTTGKVKPGAEVWESRTRRRLNHLFLHHIAITPDPAYPGAGVLDVRTAPTATQTLLPGPAAVHATPNLDRFALDALKAQMAALDARYPH